MKPRRQAIEVSLQLLPEQLRIVNHLLIAALQQLVVHIVPYVVRSTSSSSSSSAWAAETPRRRRALPNSLCQIHSYSLSKHTCAILSSTQVVEQMKKWTSMNIDCLCSCAIQSEDPSLLKRKVTRYEFGRKSEGNMVRKIRWQLNF